MNKKNDEINQDSEVLTHIRRCHVCDTVNECPGGEVDRCQSCHKFLAPFFFCESTYSTEITELSKAIFTNKNKGLKSIYPPLMGIALHW
jgi:hypothetical protein